MTAGENRPGRRGSRLRGVAAFIGALGVLAFPATASAVPVTIDGSPLNITTDEFGHAQAVFDSDCGCGQFDGNGAGLFIGLAGGGVTGGFDYFPTTPPAISGSGTSADPYQVTSQYETSTGGPELLITQVDSYVNGETGFTQTFTITVSPVNPASTIPFRAILFADLIPGADDNAHALLDGGPPRFLGAGTENYETAGGLVEVAGSPWDAFQAGDAGAVAANRAGVGSPGFNNSVDGGLTDAAVGIQWDDHTVTGVGPGGDPAAVHVARWEFRRIPPSIHAEKFVVRPAGGTVLVKAPGQADFRQLFDPRRVPIGTLVDARAGFADVVSDRGDGNQDTATFWDGLFSTKQTPRSGSPFNAKLAEQLRCKGGKKGRVAIAGGPLAAASAGGSRRLWGKGNGRFRTTGYRGSATSRGTEWLTLDRCKGKKRSTRFKVISGVLAIDDFTKKKAVNKLLRRGGYTAK